MEIPCFDNSSDKFMEHLNLCGFAWCFYADFNQNNYLTKNKS